MHNALNKKDKCKCFTKCHCYKGSHGTGKFEFDASYYTDNTYARRSEISDVKIVGERLYFGIKPTAVIEGLSFYVEECVISQGRQ